MPHSADSRLRVPAKQYTQRANQREERGDLWCHSDCMQKTSQLAERHAGQSGWRSNTLLYTKRSSCVPALVMKSFDCTRWFEYLAGVFWPLILLLYPTLLQFNQLAKICPTVPSHSGCHNPNQRRRVELRMPISLSGCPLLLQCADSSRKWPFACY